MKRYTASFVVITMVAFLACCLAEISRAMPPLAGTSKIDTPLNKLTSAEKIEGVETSV